MRCSAKRGSFSGYGSRAGRRLYLNDEPRPIVEYEEDPAGSLPAGRIALYAMKLIATFESLEVTPLDAD